MSVTGDVPYGFSDDGLLVYVRGSNDATAKLGLADQGLSLGIDRDRTGFEEQVGERIGGFTALYALLSRRSRG